MIIIPEIETVVILVPRTGSGSLRRAVAKRYPESMLLYRHMEADGIPRGYDHWERVGVIREPLSRLWSLYKFMRGYRPARPDQGQAYVEMLRRSASAPFSEWLVHNQTIFTSPFDSSNRGGFWPQYTVNHPLPENRKSQYWYLQPNHRTTLFPFSGLRALEAHLDIQLGLENKTDPESMPPLSDAAAEHAARVFAWDFETLTRLNGWAS